MPAEEASPRQCADADCASPEAPPQSTPSPEENAHPTAAGGRCPIAQEFATKPYQQEVEELIQNTPMCKSDLDHKILLIFDELHERGRMDAALKHLYEVIHRFPRSKVHHWRGYLHKLLRDFDDEAYHSVKAKLAAKHAERLPWNHEPCDHQHLRPTAPKFEPGHLGWKGELHPEDFAACAGHKLHAEAAEFHPGDLTYIEDPAASKNENLHVEAPEFHPGDAAWGVTDEEAEKLKREIAQSQADGEAEGVAETTAEQKENQEPLEGAEKPKENGEKVQAENRKVTDAHPATSRAEDVPAAV